MKALRQWGPPRGRFRDPLSINIGRDRNDEGHGVLIVKTDAGEFVLDNQNLRILPRYRTGYRYIRSCPPKLAPDLKVGLRSKAPFSSWENEDGRCPLISGETRLSVCTIAARIINRPKRIELRS